MKRIFLYILILAAVLLIPLERTDVGDLQPVQTVAVFRDEDGYLIQTDTGDEGRGVDPVQALQNLEETTPGVVYLDTAQYLLVSESATVSIEDLRQYLRKSVQLYHVVGTPELETASKYLSVHGDGPELKYWSEDVPLPILDCRDDRIKLIDGTQ